MRQQYEPVRFVRVAYIITIEMCTFCGSLDDGKMAVQVPSKIPKVLCVTT